MQKITPYLWYDNQAEEAVNFYLSLFKNSRILSVSRYEDAGPGPAGTVRTIAFQLDGLEFVAINGGPYFKFTEAVSLFVNCETQEEVDWLWAKFTESGEEGQCGWLKDQYGLSWQIIPAGLVEMLTSSDAEKSQRATQAMFSMKKIDLAEIKLAYEGIS
jgi:predicted 3-demethylubiquinone-9 3-methyltransferase (glyoxalase superfamily)